MSKKNGEIIIYGKFKSGAKDGSVADMSQIKGLPDALNSKADKTELTAKADKTEIPQFVYVKNEDAVPTDRDSRTVFLVGVEEKKIINFYVNEGTIHTYQAEEGMTWQEYVESDFKHEDIRINYDYNQVEHEKYPIKTADYSIVNSEDVIISGYTYLNGYYWGGAN